MKNLSEDIAYVVESLKIIPEPFSIYGIINVFNDSVYSANILKNFAIYFSKNDEATLWYSSKNYDKTKLYFESIKSVIDNRANKIVDNIKIYPLIARNVCFGAIVIEARDYILESKRFSFLINYFASILYTEKLSFQANKDKLTSLYNRGYILKVLNRYIADGKEYSIIIADLDRFKHYNDKYGHNTGDHILKLASFTMKNTLKNSTTNTTLARYGGEEFIIVVDTHSVKELESVMELLRKTIEDTDFSTHDYALRVTMSLGGSISSKNEDISRIIENADKALYNSKNTGRNKSSIY